MNEGMETLNELRLKHLRDKISFYSNLKHSLIMQLNDNIETVPSDTVIYDQDQQTAVHSNSLTQLTVEWYGCLSELKLSLDNLLAFLNTTWTVINENRVQEDNVAHELKKLYLVAGKGAEKSVISGCGESDEKVDELRHAFYTLRVRQIKAALKKRQCEGLLNEIDQLKAKYAGNTNELACCSVNDLQQRSSLLNAEKGRILSTLNENSILDQLSIVRANFDTLPIFERDYESRSHFNTSSINFQSKIQDYVLRRDSELEEFRIMLKNQLNETLTKCKLAVQRIQCKLSENASKCDAMQCAFDTKDTVQVRNNEESTVSSTPRFNSSLSTLHDLMLRRFADFNTIQANLEGISCIYSMPDSSRQHIESTVEKLESMETNLLDTLNMIEH